MEQLIKGDYLYFTIGNLIADTAIASFAYFIFRAGELDNKISNYIFILESSKVDPIEIYKIKTAFLLYKFSELEDTTLAEDQKKALTNFYEKRYKLNTHTEYLFLLFLIAILIELCSIVSTRI